MGTRSPVWILSVTLSLAACRSDEASAPEPTGAIVAEPEVQGPVGTLRWARAGDEPRAEAREPTESLPTGWGFHSTRTAPRSEPEQATPPAEGGQAFLNPLLVNVIYEQQASSSPSSHYYLGATIELAGLGYESDGAAVPRAPSRRERARTVAWEDAELASGSVAANATHAAELSVGEGETLPLESVEASVWVEGSRARVVLDHVFRNDLDRTLEGQFKLRLPADASPFYLAFGAEVVRDDRTLPLVVGARGPGARGHAPAELLADRAQLGSALKEARLVPKQEAARSYRRVVSRGVDPALMEWAGPGVFRTRVFPLEPGRSHRIVVGYDLDLTEAGAGLELALDFPPETPLAALHAEVLEPRGAAVLAQPPGVATRDGERTSFEHVAPVERAFRIRVVPDGTTALACATDEAGELFYVPWKPALPSEPAPGASRAVLLLDTSASSAEDAAIWLELLDALLSENEDDLREVAVLLFDVQTRWWRPGFAPNTARVRAELRRDLAELALGGATDLHAALGEASTPSWWDGSGAPWDVFLLGDGAATWGPTDPAELAQAVERGNCGALFAYSTGRAGAERAALERLARDARGAVFVVSGPAEIPSAARAHRSRPWRIVDVSCDGGFDLLLAGGPDAVFPGQTLRLAGRGRPRPGAQIELAVERGGELRAVGTPIEHVLDSTLAARAFGCVAVLELEELGRPLRDEARALAGHFRVPGRSVSLLMLETEEDYVEAGLTPEVEVARTQLARELSVAEISERLRGDQTLRRADALGRFREQVERVADLGLALSDVDGLYSLAGELGAEVFTVRARPPECTLLRRADLPAAIAALGNEPEVAALEEAALQLVAAGKSGDALRLYSVRVEQEPGEAAVARDVALAAAEWGHADAVYPLLLALAEARPWEAPVYLDLARLAASSGHVELALAWYELVWQGGDWNGVHGDLRRVAAVEYAPLLRRVLSRRTGLGAFAARRLADVHATLGFLQADLVVTVSWSTDATDVDLHVVDPAGEHCFYGQQVTQLGGRLSADVTTGLGPEVFVLPSCAPGDYDVFVEYFSGNVARASTRTRVRAAVWQDWGGPAERVAERTFPLVTAKERQALAFLSVPRATSGE